MSSFHAVFGAALVEYTRKTGKDINADPLTTRLRSCTSPIEVHAVLQEQAQKFDDFRNGGRKRQIMKRLKPIVDVLLTLSNGGVLGNGIGLKFPPANAIVAGIGLLLAASKSVSTSYDALIDLFECLENYLGRLRIFTEIPASMEEILVKIMVELLGVLALATLQIRQGRLKKFARKLLGENDIEAVLQRLDRLTMEESRMTGAQAMEVVHGLFNNMKAVMEDGRASTDSIHEALVKLQEIAESVNKIKRDHLQKAVRKWLSPPDPSVNHNIACESHHEGTATWFTGSDVYKEWKAQGSFAWILGKPGSGKSVLCSSIIRDLETMRNAGLISLAFYYFDFKDSGKQDRRGLLSSLLLQLTARSNAFHDILERLYLAHDEGSWQPSENSLSLCLKDVLAVPGQGKIYIIVDGLDECPNNSGIPTSREKVLKLVKELHSLRPPHVRICITSRPEVDIRSSLEHLTSHCVSLHDEGGQRKDIIDYLKHVIETDPKMGRWREDDKQLVIKTLARKADGMFRWVYCQLDTLRRCFPGSIRRALNELPRTLDETYERILQNIDEEKWEYALRLFRCLTVARRPLQAKELAEVLAVELDTKGIPKLNVDLRPKDADEAVLSACSTLVAIVRPNTLDFQDDMMTSYNRDIRVVQFAHYSVKEFLTSSRLESSRQALSRFYVSPEPAHTILVQGCIGTLLQLDNSVNGNNFRGFPLAGYAVQNWVAHAQADGVASQVQIGMESLFDPEMPHFTVWVDFRQTHWSFSGEPKRFPLSYAARYGLEDVVKYLVTERRQHIDATDPDLSTPLLEAQKGGHLAVAQLLLRYGAHVDCRSGAGLTPLHSASRDAQLDIVQLLLEWGANVNSCDRNKLTPLHEASERGYIDIAQQLINFGADLNFRDKYGVTPLHKALQYGRLSVIPLLIEQGADVNMRYGRDSTPLHESLEHGYLDIAHQLINFGADPNARDKFGVSPLHKALQYERPPVVPLLIEGGADVNTQHGEDSTPLHEVSECEYLDDDYDMYGVTVLHNVLQYERPSVVPLLIERGADVNTRHGGDLTPLHEAPKRGYLDIAHQLINFGADLNARDIYGVTPLHKAVQYGRSSAVPLLIERGADVNTRYGGDSTPLHEASKRGYLDTVQQLINFGADLNARDKYGVTPLYKALQYEKASVIPLSIERGADVNMRHGGDSTPLHEASKRGYLDTVQQLIDFGADLNARDKYGVTPLQKAFENRKLDVVQLLIERGADVNIQYSTYSTPLHEASKCGYEYVAQKLLNFGANINARDDQGATPLHTALRYGKLNVLRLLLERGADVNPQDDRNLIPLHEVSEGASPLHGASQYGILNVVRLLLDYGADAKARDSHGASPLHKASLHGHLHVVALLLRYPVDPGARDGEFSTPLHYASRGGHVTIVEELLWWGADIEARDNYGSTPLCEASIHGQSKVVVLLLKRRAAVNACNDNNQTALHLAAFNGHADTARWLVQHGADVNAQDNEGQTPFSVALGRGNRKVARLLSDLGS